MSAVCNTIMHTCGGLECTATDGQAQADKLADKVHKQPHRYTLLSELCDPSVCLPIIVNAEAVSAHLTCFLQDGG